MYKFHIKIVIVIVARCLFNFFGTTFASIWYCVRYYQADLVDQ